MYVLKCRVPFPEWTGLDAPFQAVVQLTTGLRFGRGKCPSYLVKEQVSGYDHSSGLHTIETASPSVPKTGLVPVTSKAAQVFKLALKITTATANAAPLFAAILRNECKLLNDHFALRYYYYVNSVMHGPDVI